MLSEQQLEEILRDYSFWNAEPPLGVARQTQLPSQLSADLVLIIQGVRRCGKSTLLTQLPKHYDLPGQQCYFCNFEDPRLLDDLTHGVLQRILALARKKVPQDKPCYFFLDEIQNVEAWEKWLHVQLERPKNNYFVLTGSNSCLLSGEFATALTGRHITINLYPFSFPEYQTLYPDKTLEDYFLSGGFPRSLSFSPPYQLLREYFEDIISRDVLKRVNARTSHGVKQVLKMAFESCGSALSYRKIAAVTDLSVDTVKSYLNACENACLLFSCPCFAFSEKKQLMSAKKYYPVDSGLRYAVINASGKDLGKSLEWFVFLQLKKHYGQVYYWQEAQQGEVDFVVQHDNRLIPYQVSWESVEPRHQKALNHFYEHFPNADEAVFVTYETANQMAYSK